MNGRNAAQMKYMDTLSGFCFLTVFIFVIVLVLLIPIRQLAQGSEIDIAAATHCVKAGDSLWSISAEHLIPGCSIQECSSWILEHNDINGSVLIPGQIIVVPAT